MSDESIKNKASNLFKYIKNALESTLRVSSDLNKFPLKLFEKDFIDNKYIKTIFDNPNQKEYIKIKYPNLAKPPKYPDDLEGYIENYPQSPSLINEAEEDEDIENIIIRNKQRKEAFTEFLPQYEDWKSNNISELEAIDLFNKVFSHKTNSDENYEFILGFGILSWSTVKTSNFSTKHNINYPLITLEVNVNLDKDDKTLVIEPVEDKPPILEDIVISDYVSDIVSLKNDFNDLDLDITDKATYLPLLLKTINSFINPDDRGLVNGELINDIQNPTYIDENLRIYNTWGLFYRKRRQNAELEDLQKYIAVLDNTNNIETSSLNAFLEDACTETKTYNQVDYDELKVLEDNNILFPLPFNEEQINILNKIENSNNVIVLGPPGTGKSHTIANLVSHFLAKGKRVLVTSQKEQALNVLLNKIPEELRCYCVPVLSNIQDGKRKMEEAFNGISKAISYSDIHIHKEIEQLNSDIQNINDKIINIKEKIKFVSANQLCKIAYKNDLYLPMELIQILESKKEEFSWLQDEIQYIVEKDTDGNIIVKPKVFISTNEFSELLLLHNDLKNYLYELEQSRISTKQLLNIEQFEEFSKNYIKLQNLNSDIKLNIPDLTLKDIDRQEINEFLNLLSKKVSIEQNITEDWQRNLLNSISDLTEREKLNSQILKYREVQNQYDNYYKDFDVFNQIKINSPLNLNELINFIDTLLLKLKDNKNIYSFWDKLFLSKKEKYTINNITINAKTPVSISDFEQIKLYLKLIECYKNNGDIWNTFANRYDCPKYAFETKVYKDSDLNLEIYNYYFDENNSKQLKNNWESVSNLFEYRNISEEIETISDYIISNSKNILNNFSADNILDTIKLILDKDNYETTNAKYEELKILLSNFSDKSSINKPFLDALNLITTNREESLLLWSKTYNQFLELESFNDKYKNYQDLYNKLEMNVPILAKNLFNNNNQILSPEKLQQGLQFKAILKYLSVIINDTKDLHNYELSLANLIKQLRKLKVQLIVKTTIKNLKSNHTQEDDRNLANWQMAIKKLGAGKSKHIVTKMADVKEASKKAKNSIPVWIMPTYKVSESLPSEIGLFDVVIIDEASQSDIRAFLSLIRGKKVIIVGDPNQVSPLSVGASNRTQIQQLIREYLNNIPGGKYFDLETSIYDVAKLTLGGTNILKLREHFRCLPEIIKFCNDLCYLGEIIPLRYISQDKKLAPVLESIFIKNGRRNDNVDINKYEAIAICQKVKQIVTSDDSKYKNKTIGIISLQGLDQAKYIQSIIGNYVTTDEQIKHQIRIGDSATFQGDERDIILLSMIVSPNDTKHIQPMVKDMNKQRYNVAVSRAKDKLILVHSIKLEDLTNSNCMRYKLLEFFNNKNSVEKIEQDESICDSDFEREVYRTLSNKGYNVVPQVKVGPYRIDLVIEGSNNRLGVECDGDKYHQPDKWFEDSIRQKQLERMGWSIYRIWGADFLYRKNEIIEDLIKTLNDYKIYPYLNDKNMHNDIISHEEVIIDVPFSNNNLDINIVEQNDIENEQDFTQKSFNNQNIEKTVSNKIKEFDNNSKSENINSKKKYNEDINALREKVQKVGGEKTILGQKYLKQIQELLDKKED